VTICTQSRECLFGEINNDRMHLNESGNMVETVWNEIPGKYPDVEIDTCMVMPNHIHGIIVLSVGAGPCACPDSDGACPDSGGIVPDVNVVYHDTKKGHPRGDAPTRLSLPDVVHRFKSFTTTKYRTGVKQCNWTPFPGKLWQRNYYEHIIRNENELNRIRDYIVTNPLQWLNDRNNPVNCNDAK